jgi:hypothetical protein
LLMIMFSFFSNVYLRSRLVLGVGDVLLLAEQYTYSNILEVGHLRGRAR